MMSKRACLILTIVALLGAALGCGFLISPSPSDDLMAPPVDQAVSTPLPGWEALTLTPPITAPLAPAFPLPADLFYLNDAGQIWRQPLDGGEGQLISRPDQVVQDFAVAPGGRHLLYRVDGVLFGISTDGTGRWIVAEEIGGPVDVLRGRTVAWAPDASRMAYVTIEGFQVFTAAPEAQRFDVPEASLIDLAWSGHDTHWLLIWREDTTAALYDITTSATLRAEIGPINGYTWMEDGRVAFAPASGGLAVLAPEDLASRTFIVSQDYFVALLAQRQDDSLVFFMHEESVDAPGFLYQTELDISFYPVSSVPVETTGKFWTPDAMRLLYVSNEQTVTLIDPLTGALATFGAQGTPTSFDWGDLMPPEVTGLRLPADLFFLAPFEDVEGVWHLSSDGSPPEPVITPLMRVVDFDVAPDGVRVAFATSDGLLHLAELPNPQDITTLESALPSPWLAPTFSPDGRQLAYASGGIWVLDLTTSEARQLVRDEVDEENVRRTIIYRHPRWSPQGNWLLVDVGFYEGSDTALLAVHDENPEPLLLDAFGASAEWTPSGQVLLYSTGSAYTGLGLTLVVPGDVPVVDQLLDMPVVEVQALRGGRLTVLRPSFTGIFPWPPTLQVFSVSPDGGDLRSETDAFTLEAPVLSPDAAYIAGLKVPSLGESGDLVGRLAVFNVQTGEMFLIQGTESAHGLRWEP